jgi:putative SbcD/Mre11-related phosphoesterase
VTLDLGVPVDFRDRALSLHGPDALVLADLHVGRDEASNVELPLGERAALRDRLVALVDRFDPATVVFAGDLLHTFSAPTDDARASLAGLARACRDRGASVVAVAGNHDTALDAVWDGSVHDEVRLDDGTVVCHGHAEPAGDAPRYVVGHDHPAIEIEGQRHPCLLYGEGVYRNADLFVLPAFSPLAAGAVVNGMRARDFQSPLVRRAGALRPVVHDESSGEALSFPPLGEFRRLL